jgi:hypothetical protein
LKDEKKNEPGLQVKILAFLLTANSEPFEFLAKEKASY